MRLEEIEIIQNKYKRLHEMLNDNISTLYNPHEQVTKEWKIDYSIECLLDVKKSINDIIKYLSNELEGVNNGK